MLRHPKALLFAVMAASVASSCFSKYYNQYYHGIAIDIGINIILAVSLNLINGHTGQFSLGHAGFMAAGAYTAASMTWALSGVAGSPMAAGFVFALSLATGGVVSAVCGLAVGVPSLRLRGDYLAIVTLGFGEIIRVVLQTTDTLARDLAAGGDVSAGGLTRLLNRMGGASGMSGIADYTTFGWAWALGAVTVFTVTALVNSTYGRGFIAVHDDELAASAMGINPVRYKVTAFVIGAFFAGVAGGLYAHQKLVLNPTGFDFMRSIDIVVMVILGGMGRTGGVILAAVALTILPEALRGFAEYRMILYALLIIGLMMARPQGLFSLRRAGAGRL